MMETNTNTEKYFQIFKYFIELYIKHGYDLSDVDIRYNVLPMVLRSAHIEYSYYIIDIFEKHNLLLKYNSCDNNTFLHDVCFYSGHLGIVQHVIKIWIGKNYDFGTVNSTGNTVLHHVSLRSCNYDVFKYVLDTWIFYGMDPNCENDEGVIPIQNVRGNKSRAYFLKIYRNKYGMGKITSMLLKYDIDLFEYFSLINTNNIIQQIMCERKTNCPGFANCDESLEIGDDECSSFLNEKKNL